MRITYKTVIALAGLLVCLSGVPLGAGEPVLKVTDAWIREAPPTSTMLAGYLRLENPSDDAVTLIGVVRPRPGLAR